MSRPFISRFLLPLVRGGTVEVARPLSLRDVDSLIRAHADRPAPGERDAAAALTLARRHALAPLVPKVPPLPIDRATWRLGAAVHNLLALAHPRIAEGPGADSRIERVAAAATVLAGVGPPSTLTETLARHSVVGRISEVHRRDHTVRFWLGRRTFVGRRPPARILALPRLRGVKIDTVRRGWLRDVGVHTAARPAFIALMEASPLGEALDPLRLDPPPSWGRLLSVLKFPVLCRLVAGRSVEIGVGKVGDALADALYRFSSLQDTAGPVPASPQAVAFALAFLAHITWLDHLFDPNPTSVGGVGASLRARATSRVGRATGDSSGRDLAVVLAAASEIQPALIWPADVSRASDLGRGFARHIDRLIERHDVTRSPRWPAALELGALAVDDAFGPRTGDAV